MLQWAGPFFILSLVWKTQANHLTKRMVSNRLTTEDLSFFLSLPFFLVSNGFISSVFYPEGYAEYFSPTPMPKPPGGPQTPTHPLPPLCTKLLVVECGFSRIDPHLRRSSRLELRASYTRFKPLMGVRVVTKFTSETSNRHVEKFFSRCCSQAHARGEG